MQWEMHQGMGGEHFSTNIIAKKILDVNYWWLTFQKDVLQHCQSCDDYKHIGNLTITNLATLLTILLIEPFMKWDLDLMGPIKPISRTTKIITFW
jgi:hypothetical protein